MFKSDRELICIVKIQPVFLYYALKGVVGIRPQRYYAQTREDIKNKFVKNVVLFVPEQYHADGMQGKIGDRKLFGILSEKPLAEFAFVLGQQYLQENICVDKIHYLHSEALC